MHVYVTKEIFSCCFGWVFEFRYNVLHYTIHTTTVYYNIMFLVMGLYLY